MPITELQISRIRNLQTPVFSPASRINIISGQNGSGKTSILEAIHFLSTTRSFRTTELRHLVSQGEQSALVFSRVESSSSTHPLALGVERTLDGDVRVRFDGRSLDSAELASLLPVQVLYSGTFELLDGSPSVRRQFIDWGGFHADPAFITLWRGFRRALKQRNSLLKYGKIDRFQMQVWDREFVSYGELLTQHRQAYIAALLPEFKRILSVLLGDVEVELKFHSGWDSKRELMAVLADQFPREAAQGFTLSGPQRADLRFRCGGVNAADRLSRGQKKLVVSALRLAQGQLFRQKADRPCIYLIDDLPSELDEPHARLFCQFLERSQDQCFITCVEPDTLTEFWSPDTDLALFHLDAGHLLSR
ncbi:DNA recombination protein RecF [Nitrincola sp. A-D6]|uniref:DNA replication/repair protein RecF n=1 Tax=Nitrincola sp. A-D6 TaxID=1545442 RepID=UPI00051FBF78|nr:DNA replication/repair protein RecF [Nitrincola sp. A-D6]KGK42429.1 DNA recombination protein RecF [Nitrincola sp. A-D6]